MSTPIQNNEMQHVYKRRAVKKMPLHLRLLRGLATCVASVLCCTMTFEFVQSFLQSAGASATTSTAPNVDYTLMDRYDMFVTNSVGEALDGIVTIERVYWLSDDDIVAPKPNPELAGETTDPASLQWLLDQAAETLGVTDTLFTTETQIYPGSTINYYIDKTIMVITWQEKIHDAAYTISEVKIKHASQFRRFLADGTFGSDKQYLTTEMANTVNAVTASSGDFYKFRPEGIKIYNGVVYQAEGSLDTCYIDDNGDLLLTKAGEITTKQEAEQYVKDNNVRFSLSFGPILVQDGQKVNTLGYSVGQGSKRYSRAGLGQLGELHYLLVTANLVPNAGVTTPTSSMFADQMLNFGCKTAYSLDGGQTAVIVTNGKLINRPDYGYQRQISDIIYFATAVPNGD